MSEWYVGIGDQIKDSEGNNICIMNSGDLNTNGSMAELIIKCVNDYEDIKDAKNIEKTEFERVKRENSQLYKENKKLRQLLDKASQILQDNGFEKESKEIDCEAEL